MVAKGSRVREVKNAKLEDRKDRSICVKFQRKKNFDKRILEEVIKGIHPGIDSVYMPRQKSPKYCFVLCSNEEIKKKAWELIKNFKNEEVGRLFPKSVNSKPIQRKIKTEEDIEKKKSKTVDLLTLVLEAIPKDFATEEIKANFPKATSINRFNDRRCYLTFSSIPDCFFALKKLRTEPLCGFKIAVRYNRIPRPKKTIKQKIAPKCEEKEMEAEMNEPEEPDSDEKEGNGENEESDSTSESEESS